MLVRKLINKYKFFVFSVLLFCSVFYYGCSTSIESIHTLEFPEQNDSRLACLDIIDSLNGGLHSNEVQNFCMIKDKSKLVTLNDVNDLTKLSLGKIKYISDLKKNNLLSKFEKVKVSKSDSSVLSDVLWSVGVVVVTGLLLYLIFANTGVSWNL